MYPTDILNTLVTLLKPVYLTIIYYTLVFQAGTAENVSLS